MQRRVPDIEIIAIPEGSSLIKGENFKSLDIAPRILTSKEYPLLSIAQAEATQILQQADLDSIITPILSRSTICASTNYHFLLPSGAHTSRFLRLAEAFTSLETVDRIAYWVTLRIVQNSENAENKNITIVVDNPSMLVLAARVQVILGANTEVQTFQSYPSSVESNKAAVEILESANSRGNFTHVIIGVSSD
jgi:hypothetical protein